MASLEQLQMLDDDETTTSSSDSSSDGTTDDVANSLTASNDDDTDDKSTVDEDGGDDSRKRAASATDGKGHQKKRIKLSLGGSFKAMASSAGQERQDKAVSLEEKPANASAGKETGSQSIGDSNSETKAKPETDLSPRKKIVSSEAGAEGSSSRKESPQKADSGKKNPRILPASKPKTKLKPKETSTSVASDGKNNTNQTKGAQQQQKQAPPVTPSLAISKASSSPSHNKKRSSMRSIRITPMSSPGLLLPPGTSARVQNSGSASDSTSMVSPNQVFAQTMAAAGYTAETRAEFPHRGSSVERTVGDMFDSDVKICLHFPKLVPGDLFLLPAVPGGVPSAGGDATKPTPMDGDETKPPSAADPNPDSKATDEVVAKEMKLKAMEKLSERLIKAFQKNNNGESSLSTASSENNTGSTRNHRKTIPQYSDMAPLSLTLPYPKEYTQKRLEYIAKVNERERAIVLRQEEKESTDVTPEGTIQTSTDSVPPIPSLPQIPEPSDLRAITHNEEMFGSKGQQEQNHPFYLPENNRLVDHLDRRCFHAMSGRYFGLSSNTIADPYFYGPSAPGIGGLNLSATTGLAIASSGGGGGSVGVPLLATPSQSSSSAPSSSASVVAANISKTLASQSSTTSKIASVKPKTIEKPTQKAKPSSTPPQASAAVSTK